MLKEFLMKITDWVLQKEEEAAKNCAIPIEELDKQIQKLQEKKEELQKKCEEQIKTIDNLLERIEKIKNEEKLKCNNKNS